MDERLSIEELEETYITDLNLLGDWFLQYEYLLEITSELPRMAEEKKTDENRVRGCQAQVYVYASFTDGRLTMEIDSDSFIVRGILCILAELLNGRTPEEILSYSTIHFIERTGLKNQLSTDRFGGINSILARIHRLAEEQQI